MRDRFERNSGPWWRARAVAVCEGSSAQPAGNVMVSTFVRRLAQCARIRRVRSRSHARWMDLRTLEAATHVATLVLETGARADRRSRAHPT